MMSVIKQLWYGSLYPIGKSNDTTDKTKELILKLDESEKSIVMKMTEEEKQAFERHLELTDEMYSNLLADAFAQGFKLGARLIKEALEP